MSRPLPHNGTPNSKAAAALMEQGMSTLRARVFKLIWDAGDEGMTDPELYQATPRKFSESAVRPRRWELERDGIIQDSGRTRKTRAGCAATVWVVAPKHRKVAR